MTLRLLRPVPKGTRVSSPFGKRLLEGKLVHHNGTDFAVPVGTPIHAAVDGLVQRAGWEDANHPTRGYGLRVMQAFMVDGVRYFSWYGHLSKVLVDEGRRLRAGDVVGLSGNTGHSTGPHLHFGVRQSDTPDFMEVEFYDEPSLEVA